MSTTRKFFVSALVLASLFLFSCADDSGDSANAGTNSETGGTKRTGTVLRYDESKDIWVGSATWSAANATEQALIGFVDSMYFKLYDANGTERWSEKATVVTDTSKCTVTGTIEKSLSTRDGTHKSHWYSNTYDISTFLMWADIPETELKVFLKFSTGTELTVASQKEYGGPDSSSSALSYINQGVEKGFQFATHSPKCQQRWENSYGSDSFSATDGLYKVAFVVYAGISEYEPVVKLAGIEATVMGKKCAVQFDWTDANFLDEYSEYAGLSTSGIFYQGYFGVKHTSRNTIDTFYADETGNKLLDGATDVQMKLTTTTGASYSVTRAFSSYFTRANGFTGAY